jgi:hypothetical protein
MKSLVVLSLGVLVFLAVAEAGGSGPKSSPIPGPTSGEEEEPALPTPDATPQDAGPVLLPESGQLPARPGVERPASSSINRGSVEPSAKEKVRFDEVRSAAMSNPRAANLLKRARNSRSVRVRSTYLRAYYSTVAARMRKLDPELKSSIDAYEEARVGQVTGAASSSNGISHRSRSNRTATRGPHRRYRRVAAHHRHERMMIIYDPYGPYMPPYGPYGPYMPPYGPPVVFEPW